MINNKKVGQAITVLRKRQKLTQKDLADKLNVSDKAISKWERGLGLPDISILSTLSMILDTDMESLLEGNATYKKDNWIGILNLNDINVDVSTLIFDKPIITYQIGYFMLAGIKDIYIYGKDINKKYIKQLVKGIKINVYFVDNVNEVPCVNTMYIHKPLFIYGQNVTRSFQKAMERKDGVTILSLPEHIINNVDILYDSNHKVINKQEKAIETAYKYNALPIIFYPNENYISNSYLELDRIIDTLVDKDILYTEPMFRGVIYIPLDTNKDVKDASKIVEIIQKRDYSIGDLKEIELRRGFI